ncbi:MAG: glycosyltransferase family 9 protein [Chitinophagaceae bacterium]|nr:glycosyltransferase family 9 protein [Chitinophagaceae bacterium]
MNTTTPSLKFLIIRFSSIGDIVLTTPIIRCLKQQVENCEVHYLTKSQYASIVESNPYVDKVIQLDKSWLLMMHLLKIEKYDYIIDLHHNLRTLRIKSQLKAKAFSFNKLNIEKWLMTALKINLLPKKHIVDRYFDTLKDFDIIKDGKGLDYFIPPKDIVPFEDLPTAQLFGFIAVVIGAAHNTKRLPTEKIIELCDQINHPIILLGGKEDRSIGDEIANAIGPKVYNACGKFNLNESADLIQKSKVVITHDTGLMHIAAALKKKILSIWGNTIPEFGMTPYYGNTHVKNEIFEVKGLRCRPCTKIGYDVCPKKHFKCMQLQSIETINNTAIQLID